VPDTGDSTKSEEYEGIWEAWEACGGCGGCDDGDGSEGTGGPLFGGEPGAMDEPDDLRRNAPAGLV
jgi:hypothetical protein